MKKLLMVAMVAFAAVAAKADTYLYWTVNVGDFTDACVAKISGVHDDGSFISLGGLFVGGDAYTSIATGTADPYTEYLVKLFDNRNNEIAYLTTAVNYSDTLSKFAYQGGTMSEKPASPYSFSGFTASIPEPTSGLLLLLGLGALALKRSRLR